MSLFKKKEAAPEAPPETPLPDDAGWRRWSERGFEKLDGGNLAAAVEHWVQAIDRFDDEPRFFVKFRKQILDKVISGMCTYAKQGRIIPTHLLAELDAEIYLKHRELSSDRFVDDIFYYVKENMSSAEGPEEAVMYFFNAAYAIAGYLRFSTDLRVSAERCDEVLRLADYCLAQCNSYGRHYRGGLKPKYVAPSLRGVTETFRYLMDKLNEAADSMSEEELASLREYRESHMDDRLDPLSFALQNGINTVGMGKKPRGKAMAALEADIDKYMQMFLSKGE